MKHTLEDELNQIRRRRKSTKNIPREVVVGTFTRITVYGLSLLAMILVILAIASAF